MQTAVAADTPHSTTADTCDAMQVEVWVQIADAQAHILDCKEYYAPLITPYEAWLAFQDLDLDPAAYRMDLACVHEVPAQRCEQAALGCIAFGSEGEMELKYRNARCWGVCSLCSVWQCCNVVWRASSD